jgi:hypothetical protein
VHKENKWIVYILQPTLVTNQVQRIFYTHAETIDKAIVIESAVLAGPVTFTETVTVTGTLVIV